jgi:predicted ArsR family transcriptional regulator
VADADERTRDRVLSAVLEHGPVSAAELGDLLGFTPAAVRRHLDHLSRAGVIEVKRVAKSGGGAGRPARRYVLSSQGQSSLGNDYLDIAALALQQLQKMAGPDAVRAFAVERSLTWSAGTRRKSTRPDRTSPTVPGRWQRH